MILVDFYHGGGIAAFDNSLPPGSDVIALFTSDASIVDICEHLAEFHNDKDWQFSEGMKIWCCLDCDTLHFQHEFDRIYS